MARLDGKNVVVAGGTGRVGEGLVRSFLLEGAQVIVPVRSVSKEQRLRSYLGDVDCKYVLVKYEAQVLRCLFVSVYPK